MFYLQINIVTHNGRDFREARDKRFIRDPEGRNRARNIDKFARKIMIWASIAHEVKSRSIFPPIMSLNTESIISDVLKAEVIPACRAHHLTFQQDGASPCTARKLLDAFSMKS